MTHITITDSYYALVCYRRGNILFLPAKTVTFQPLPSDFTVGPYSRRILFYTLARPVYARFARFATPSYPAPFFISRDFTSLFREISLHYFERFHFIIMRFQVNVMRDSFSILNIHPPSIFTVGMIWRRILSTFLFSTFHFVHKPPPPFLRRLCDLPFFTLDSFITRDYTSLLLGFQLIITRYYSSLLREIKYLNYTTRRLFLP